jgi:23S rRNA pseudouridine1911/1915/1917 synthase
VDKIWTWTVDAATAADRADRRILEALEEGRGRWAAEGGDAPAPALTRSQLQRLIEEGRVTADGAALRANTKLRAGARVELRVPPARRLELMPEDRPLEILYEDAELVVVNKPPGLTVHPAPSQPEGTLVHALLHHVKDLSGIGGALRPGIVHRLDKDTSGALVVTKTDRAHQALVKVFARHEIERRYWALCYGIFPAAPAELRIESLIGRNPADRKKMSMKVARGRRAVTYVRTLERFGTHASLVEARLETGRTHQVRVHLTGAGHSLIGDPVYGTPTAKAPKWLSLPADAREAAAGLPGQALHARVLGFTHPVTGRGLRFEAEPPEAFQALLRALRKNATGV